MKSRYTKIIKAKETEDFNVIDKARAILLELLDDENITINSEVGEIIQAAADLIE